jgi:hypothetical protein
MLGNSSVATQLVASQEGVSSMSDDDDDDDDDYDDILHNNLNLYITTSIICLKPYCDIQCFQDKGAEKSKYVPCAGPTRLVEHPTLPPERQLTEAPHAPAYVILGPQYK